MVRGESYIAIKIELDLIIVYSKPVVYIKPSSLHVVKVVKGISNINRLFEEKKYRQNIDWIFRVPPFTGEVLKFPCLFVHDQAVPMKRNSYSVEIFKSIGTTKNNNRC